MTAPTSPADLSAQWRDAFNAGDLPRLMAMYEADAVLVSGPGAPPLHGHPAIRAALTGFLALHGQIRFTPRHWVDHGDLALGSVGSTLDGGRDGDGNTVELAGTTAEVVHRQPDGTWKYVIDHPFAGEH